MTVPVTVCEDLSANVFSNNGAALKVHEHAADGGLLGTRQLLICHLACYSLQEEQCAVTRVYMSTVFSSKVKEQFQTQHNCQQSGQ